MKNFVVNDNHPLFPDLKSRWKKTSSKSEKLSFYLKLQSIRFGYVNQTYKTNSKLNFLRPLASDYKLAKTLTLNFLEFFEHKESPAQPVYLDDIKIKRISSFLRNLKALRELKVIFIEEYPLRYMKYFFFALSRLKSLRQLKLEIESSNKSSTYYTWREINFEKWIRPLKYLSNLHLADPFANLHIIKNISHCKKLRSFSIWLNNPDLQDYDEKLHIIQFTLARHIRLEKLSLEVICVEINSKSTEFIKKILVASHTLKSLKVNIDGACRLLENFREKSLDKLEELIIPNDRKSMDYDAGKVIDVILNAPNLQNFFIVLENKELTNMLPKTLRKGISRLKNLVNFGLMARKSENFTDDAIEDICESIKPQKNLTSFLLNLKSDRITDKIAHFIHVALENKKFFKKLHLDLGECGNITDRAWLSLKEQLENIQNLYIDFNLCERVQDGLPRYLVEALENSKKLTVIEIHIGDLNNLRDGTLLNFKKLCQSADGLRDVLLFINDAKLTEFGFKAMGEGLSNLKSLTSFKLKVPFINDLKIKEIMFGLSAAKGLNTLQLNFLDAGEMNDSGLLYIRDLVAELNKLENLMIWSMRDNKFSAVALDELKRTMQTKRYLKELCLQLRLDNLSKGDALSLERSFRESKKWKSISAQIIV